MEIKLALSPSERAPQEPHSMHHDEKDREFAWLVICRLNWPSPRDAARKEMVLYMAVANRNRGGLINAARDPERHS